MFENLGLNVARQEDNGKNPRPDNRSEWLEGETPDVIAQTLYEETLHNEDPREAPAIELSLWDPSTQLRHKPKSSVPPRPDGAENKYPDREPAQAA